MLLLDMLSDSSMTWRIDRIDIYFVDEEVGTQDVLIYDY